MSTPSLGLGMSMRPSMRGNCWSNVFSSTALVVGLGVPSGLRCCAVAGTAAAAIIRNPDMPTTTQMRASSFVMVTLLPSGRSDGSAPRRSRGGSSRNPFVISGRPAPGAGAVAALRDPIFIDLGDDFAIAGEQRFGGAHLGTQRQLSFEQPIGAVFLVFRD